MSVSIKINTPEIRTKADLTIPCPDCGAECHPDEVTKLGQLKGTKAGKTLVLPNHYLDLKCPNCNLQLWVAIDEDGNPISD